MYMETTPQEMAHRRKSRAQRALSTDEQRHRTSCFPVTIGPTLTRGIARLTFASKSMEASASTEPVVHVTESAAQELKSLLTKPENAGKVFRLYVEEGGCSGFKYSMTFDEQRPGDEVAEAHGVAVLVDSFSAQYLRGARVDFSDALVGGGFKVANANAKQSCGCGKSFTA